MTRRRARTALAIVAGLSASLAGVACGWDPSRPFDHEAPQVNRALTALEAGDATGASALLGEYLATGQCDEGKIGAPGRSNDRPFAGLDLGLALFRVGEAYGGPFGDEDGDGGVDPTVAQLRTAETDCALAIVRAVANGEATPLELRARARYLEGNLLFLSRRYEDAVKAYDKALTLAPGFPDGGDEVGRDAAWNRAVALKRIRDKKDAGNDASNDGSSEGGQDGGGQDSGGQDGGGEGGGDGGSDGGGKDGGSDGGGGNGDGGDASADGGNQGDAGPQQPDSGAQPPPKQSQDDRVLDRLENAPTFQHEAARKAAQQRHVGGSLDK